MPNEDDSLSPAVEAMRSDVPVRPEWRAQLLDAVSREGVPRRQLQRGLVVPRASAWAAAAALLLVGAIGGAAGSVYFLRRDAMLPAQALVAGPEGAARPIRFDFVAPSARHVSLVGDFNGWNPSATPLERRGSDGGWTITLPLVSGRHVYAFVVDGGLHADPLAPRAPEDDFGSPNSVILVAGRPE